MKKNIFKFFVFLFCVIPCTILFSACGDKDKGKDKESVAVTINFAVDEDYTFGDEWTISDDGLTYTTEYGTAYWYDSMFKVMATTETGQTKRLYEVTENNDAGYKIDTNMPDLESCDYGIPAGTYTYRLYCEDFDDGNYKTNACSSETYTIVVNKKVVDCSDVKWTIQNEEVDSVVYQNSAYEIYLTSGETPFEDKFGIFNYEKIFGSDSVYTAINVGEYASKIDFDVDNDNFEYINLPDKEFHWTITKANPFQWLNVNDFWRYNGPYVYNPGGEITYELSPDKALVESCAGIKITGYEGTISATKPGVYECTPIITQEDTTNYEIADASILRLEWEILKATVDPADFCWEGNTETTYTGSEITLVSFCIRTYYEGITFEYVTDIPNNITRTATDVGDYTAKVKLIYDTDYYDIDLESITLEKQWKITKAVFNSQYINWMLYYNYGSGNPTSIGSVNEVSYNESKDPVSAAIFKIYQDKEYPFDVTGYEVYDKQGNPITGNITEVGEYTTRAIYEITNSNYEIDDTLMVYSWKIIKGNYLNNCFEWQIYQYNASEYLDGKDLTGYEESITLNAETENIVFKAYTFGNPPYNTLTWEYSIDGGTTYSSDPLTLSVTENTEITIKIKINNQDLEHYNEIDASAFDLNILITDETPTETFDGLVLIRGSEQIFNLIVNWDGELE